MALFLFTTFSFTQEVTSASLSYLSHVVLVGCLGCVKSACFQAIMTPPEIGGAFLNLDPSFLSSTFTQQPPLSFPILQTTLKSSLSFTTLPIIKMSLSNKLSITDIELKGKRVLIRVSNTLQAVHMV